MRRFGLILSVLPLLALAQQGSWVETTREDFSDGWYERDVYCSYRTSPADPDSGAIEFVPRFDLTNNGWIDLVVSNKPTQESWDQAKADWVMIYTGAADGYNTQRFLSYLTYNGATVDGADLDLDGYADMVVCHYYSPSNAKVGAVCIYWGTPNGPSPDDTTMLPATQQTESVYISDVNKDGWLDILSSDYGRRLDTTFQSVQDSIAVFWGGPNRNYSVANATFLPAWTARHNFQVADFDKDGYYDIFVVNYFGFQNYIYWGSENGFRPTDMTRIDFKDTYPHGVTPADFNKDGWLDFVISGTHTIEQSYVYYADSTNKRQYIEPTVLNTGTVFGGCASYDYNEDGWLDVIFYRGNADPAASFHEKPWIYLGGPDGFSDTNRLEFGARKYNLSGGFLTDFNKDGIEDLFIHSWDIFDSSGVLWGPDFFTHTQLYCNKDHHSQCRDMGHVYDRTTREPYVSSVYDAGQAVNWDAILSVDTTPGNSLIRFRVRTGPSSAPDNSWTEWVQVLANGAIPDFDPTGDTVINRYLQYEANLDWEYAGELPILYEVSAHWPPGISVEPDQEDTTYPGIEIAYPLTITNDGFVNDVINVSTEGTSSGWLVEMTDAAGTTLVDNNSDGTVDVDSVQGQGGTMDFTVRLTPPDTATVGNIDTTIVWVYSTNNETVKDSAVLITHIAPLPALLIYPNQSAEAYRDSTVRYRLTVANNGNGPDVVDITGVSDLGWNFSLMDSDGSPLTDTDTDGVPDVGSIPVRDSAIMFVDVTVPSDAQEGDIDTTRVTAHSSVDVTTTSEAWLATEALVPPDTIPVVALRIEPDTLLETYPDTPVSCTLRVQNLGNRTETVDIQVTFTPEAWDYRLLSTAGGALGDANNNDIPDIGTLEPNLSERFVLEVTPPQGLGNDFTGTSPMGATTIAVLTAQSSVDTTVTDVVEDTVVVIPEFNVHNFPNPFGGPTTFYFSLPEAGKVILRIYNRAGEHLATVVDDQSYTAGVHFMPWNGLTFQGNQVAPGVLLYSFHFIPDDPEHKARTVVKKALCQGG